MGHIKRTQSLRDDHEEDLYPDNDYDDDGSFNKEYEGLCTVLLFGLFILYAIFIFGDLIASHYGYIFEILDKDSYLILIGLYSLSIATITILKKPKYENKVAQLLISLLAVMATYKLVHYDFLNHHSLLKIMVSGSCTIFLLILMRLYAKMNIMVFICALMVVSMLLYSKYIKRDTEWADIKIQTVSVVSSPWGSLSARIELIQGKKISYKSAKVYEDDTERQFSIFKIYKRPNLVFDLPLVGHNDIDSLHFQDGNLLVITFQANNHVYQRVYDTETHRYREYEIQ